MTGNFIVLIPAYNEAKTIGSIIEATRRYVDRIIIIDDGSADNTEKESEMAGAIVLKHEKNLGKGVALKTGFGYILKNFPDCEVVIILDADGQHDPTGIPKFIDAFKGTGADLIIGERMINRGEMPFLRRFGNNLVSWLVSRIIGQKITDSQAGFRLLSKKILENLKLKSAGYGIETEMLLSAAQNKFRIQTVLIPASYGDKRNINFPKDLKIIFSIAKVLFKKNNSLIFLLITGAFLILGFSSAVFWWVIWFSLVPLLFFIRQCVSKRGAFFGGLAVSFILHGYLISYFFSAYPLDWAGIESKWGLLFIFLIWLLTGGSLALFSGFFSFSAKNIMVRPRWLTVLAIPSLWVIFEYLKSWSLGILWFGPDSLFGPHWSIGNLGYVLSGDIRFLQLAGWGGVYFLSFLVVLVNCLFFLAIEDWQKKRRIATTSSLAVVAIIAVIGTVSIFGNWELQKKNYFSRNNVRLLKAALIQTDFPSVFRENFDLRREKLEAHLSLFEKIKKEDGNTRLIVITERTGFLKNLLAVYPYIKIKDILGDLSPVLVDIKSGRSGSEHSSLLFYFDTKTGQAVGEQEKIMLLPGGEYFPYLGRMAAVLMGQERWLEDFLWFRGYEKGGELKVIDLGFGKVGGLLCSEILSPVLYRSLTKQGAELLINVASDSVFRGNPVLLSQNLAMAKVRAVESNRYFLQATNAGYSYIIDNRGAIKSAGKEKGNEVIFGEAELISRKSFYAETGDWILIFAVILAFTSFLPARKF